MNFGYNISFQLLDKGNIEIFGPKSISLQLNKISTGVSNLHSGFLYNYLFTMIIFVLLFFILTFNILYFPFFFQNIALLSLTIFSYILLK